MSDETEKTNERSFLDELHQMRTELAQALGEAIWAFAMIERLTYGYMKKLSSDRLDELMGGQQFRSRIELVERLVKRLKGQEADKTVALRYIDKAKKLADKRNTLAHNPWQIWIDFDESKLKSEVMKVTDETKRLDLAMVREFREEAGEVASTLEYLLGQLHYPGP
ncbi:hypothetical protein [Paraburkholderia guartelaensis]|uniref:hypothetical protein n=1 Tax=Paraburkholderia guartelaensis TaxID=2546446 RepID=UPI002AB71328|nr:hypothetical protein [Paraburkholderia guartelaensis]